MARYPGLRVPWPAQAAIPARSTTRSRNPALILSVMAGLMVGAPAQSLTQEQISTAVLSAMDPTVDPCRDFYRYACGGWLDQTTIPGDEVLVRRGFSAAEDRIRGELLALLESAARQPQTDPGLAQAGAFFQGCMNAAAQDSGTADSAALAALEPYFSAIDGVYDSASFLQVAGRLAAIGVPAVFDIRVLPDFTVRPAGRKHIVMLDPGELGFPDPDVYLKKDILNRRLNKDYRKMTADLLRKLGREGFTARQIRDILKIEAVIAKYHPDYDHRASLWFASVAGLYSFSPAQNWGAFFDGAGTRGLGVFMVDRVFIEALGKTLSKIPGVSLRAYLRWRLADSYKAYLPKTYRTLPANLAAWQPLDETAPWKRCVDQTSRLLGHAVGKTWVAGQNSGPTLQLASALMDSVRDVFLLSLPAVAWLDDLSKITTDAKARNLSVQLGFPQQWPDYAGLRLSPSGHLANATAVRAFHFKDRTAKIGTPVDPTAWDIDYAPQTVNAAYYGVKNQIYLPLGIMQEPLLHPEYPRALNYGAAASVFAHEFTHGFGPGGNYFDKDGTYGNIWTSQSEQGFETRTDCLVKQYSRYKLPGTRIKVKGKPTLIENVADSGGLNLAYAAFKAASPPGVEAGSGIGDLTQEQLFFVAHAQYQCEKIAFGTEAYLTSRSWYEYAPSRFRTNGPLANSPDFAAAFGCPIGSAMNPAKKCRVW